MSVHRITGSFSVHILRLVLGTKILRKKLSANLKGVCHKIFRVLFLDVWIDLGLCKNL
jgi:hypothetical protein